MVLGFVLGALSTLRFAPAASHGGQAIGPSGSIQRNDPDEVFREFTFHAGASPAVKFAELDPKATFKFVGEHAWGATMPRHVPRPIELDLARAVRAELSVEYWGGHIGTSGQQFQVNSNGWVEYDDFDWDGNGVWREWQFTTHHGVLQHHLGTATNAPWRVRFDARWLPYQSQPVRVRARITDATGLVWLTPPVENLMQKRERRSVRMCKPVNVPENFCSRDSKVSPTYAFVVDADLAKAKAARLVLSTWSANVDDDSVHELRLNGQRLASRFGQFHNYSFNALDVPLSLLRAGTNEISLFSTFKGHAIEVNWPGPVLLLESAKKMVSGFPSVGAAAPGK